MLGVVAENLSDWRVFAREAWRKDHKLADRQLRSTPKAPTPAQAHLISPPSEPPPKIDIYEKNVVVIGDREGVAAARRVAERMQAESAAQARKVKFLQEHVKELKDQLERAMRGLEAAAAAKAEQESMSPSLARTMVRHVTSSDRLNGKELTDHVVAWLREIDRP